MRTTFDTVSVGQQFKFNGTSFVKTDDTHYPKHIPLHKRKTNCVNLEDNHKCVLGKKVIVEVDEIR